MFYQYQCQCGHYFEEINTVENRHNAICPICKSPNVSKLISCPKFHFSTGLSDKSGEPIYCPDGGYFDKALRRRFNNAKEKKEFMDEHNVVSMGDTDAKVKKERNEYHEKMMATDKKYKSENSNVMKGETKWAKSQ